MLYNLGLLLIGIKYSEKFEMSYFKIDIRKMVLFLYNLLVYVFYRGVM